MNPTSTARGMVRIDLPWPSRTLHPNDHVCAIDGCEKPIYSRKNRWCQMHHRRWQRHGDPIRTAKTPNGEPLRFLLETALNHVGNDCLLWPYNKTADGYPAIRHDRSKRKAHRILCEAAHGTQPSEDRMEVAHGCGNPACVNPTHLRWATAKENQADRIIHGTTNRGERQWNSKLTSHDVLTIREMEGTVSRAQIAKRFGVKRAAIDKILWGQRWAWL